MFKLFFKQLAILLWKCWIMRRRHWIQSLFELLLPLIFTLIIAAVYASHQNLPKTPAPKTEPPKNVSGGPMIFKDCELTVNKDQDFVINIHYTPENKFTSDIMKRVENYSTYKEVKGIPYENEDEINKKVRAGMSNNSEFHYNNVAVIFKKYKTNDFEYTIRVIGGNMPSIIQHPFPIAYHSGPTIGTFYPTMFSPVQIMINEAFLDKITNDNRKLKINSIEAYRFPFPEDNHVFNFNEGFSAQDIVSLGIVFGYAIMCPLIVKRITDEKVAKAKEMLRMMGMSDWVFWGSHFINYFSVMLIHNIFFTVSYCIGYGEDPIIKYSNGILFFLIVQLYCSQAILFCMFISTVLNRPVVAVVLTFILWPVSYGLPLVFQNPGFHTSMDVIGTNTGRIFTSILPNMGLAWCFSIIGQYEKYNHGVSFDNLWASTNLYGNFAVGTVMIAMLVSCIIYAILIWYIDAIWPWQFGVPKPIYFPFTASYWCSGRRTDNEETDIFEINQNDHLNFEAEPNLSVGIAAIGLHKEFGRFGTKKKVAVENVTLNVYNGQITVLLGHNGAGKTTSMNMITGIFPPTRGAAYINGYNVKLQTKEARRSMALSPQENIMYDELTVEQHLKLYAIIKDYPWNYVDTEVHKTLDLLQLTDKKYALASSLSEGMRRKLSLAVAMVGGTKILILDQPTSGMDPEGRNAVWDLLQAIRSERTILLTTHYMDEADILGDRIAIISEGTVTCCGSPKFLKKRFGAENYLRLTKDSNYNHQFVNNLIKNYLNDAQLYNETQSEVIYSFGDNYNNNDHNVLLDLFDALDNDDENLGIKSFGLSYTTLEDVFFRAEKEYENINTSESNTININGSLSMDSNGDISSKVSGISLTMQRFKGLLLKRCHFARRNWPMQVFQIFLSGLLFVGVFVTDYFLKQQIIDLPLNMRNIYGGSTGFISDNSGDDNNFIHDYIKISNNDKYGVKTEIIDASSDPNDWALEHVENMDHYIRTILIGAEIKHTDNMTVLKPWYNNEAYHTLPLSINLIYEALAYYETDEKESISININNHPYFPYAGKDDYFGIGIGWAVACLLLTPITVSFIGASYVIFPIIEHTTKSKLIQLMTGLSSLTFWTANFLFDLLNHIFAMIIIFIIFIIFDFNHVYFGQSNTGIGFFLMLFAFGFSSIPLAYCFSYFLKRPSTGFALLVIIYLFFGVIVNASLSINIILNSIDAKTLLTHDKMNILLNIFRIIPAFSVNFGIQKLYRVGSFAQFCKNLEEEKQEMLIVTCAGPVDDNNILYGCCDNHCKAKGECFVSRNTFSFDDYGVASEFIFMICDGFLFMTILWLLEGNVQKLWYRLKRLTRKIPSVGMSMIEINKSLKLGKDSDVIDERQRITNLYENDMLKSEAMGVIDLTKVFSGLTAVDHLTFGVRKKECFGLLGVNGAGKTTTFRMITGDLLITDGNAQIISKTLRRNLHLFQKQIGYCPQYDAIHGDLTGRETLYLFSRLRGLPESEISTNVQNLIDMVDLQKHADKCTKEYSGGNQRKLSLALAVIGAPPVILLDEPTAGVDLSARKKIWSTLVHVQQKYQSAIVIASDSFEECEELCSRIAMMVNGKLKCLGSTQHLKSKYGEGFNVIIKIKRDYADDPIYMTKLQSYITMVLTSAKLKESHHCILQYNINDISVKWSYIYRVMETAKLEFDFEDFSVNSTTLEQIFLNFV